MLFFAAPAELARGANWYRRPILASAVTCAGLLLVVAALQSWIAQYADRRALVQADLVVALAAFAASAAVFLACSQPEVARGHASLLVLGISFLAISLAQALSLTAAQQDPTRVLAWQSFPYALAERVARSTGLAIATYLALTRGPRSFTRATAGSATLLATALLVTTAARSIVHSDYPVIAYNIGLTALPILAIGYWRRRSDVLDGDRMLVALTISLYAELAWAFAGQRYDGLALLGHAFGAAAALAVVRAALVAGYAAQKRALAQAGAERAYLVAVDARRRRELAAVSRVQRAPLSLEQRLTEAVRAARVLLEADAAAVLSTAPPESNTRILASDGTISSPELLERGLAGLVLDSGESRWTDDASLLPSGYRSGLAVPLSLDRGTSGVLAVLSVQRAYGHSENVLLLAFARAAGPAIAHAHDHEDVQHLLDRVREREAELAAQNEELRASAEALRAAHAELEVRVDQRTTELGRANEALAEANLALAAEVGERKRAQEQIQQHLERLTALREVDRAIAGSLDLRITANVILDHVTAQLGVEAAAILVWRTDMQALQFAFGRGFRFEPKGLVSAREGQAARALVERRVMRDVTLGAAYWRPEEQFSVAHAAPIVAKGQVKGILHVFEREPRARDESWRRLIETFAGQIALAIDNVALFDDLQRSNLELALAYDTTIEGWSRALDLRDHETEGHSRRVAAITLALARDLRLGDQELAHIRRGALLHDIGKLGIPDAILSKPGPLDPAEWEIMRKHPSYARELLYPVDYLRPAMAIPEAHHEKWDGSGYPRGLRGDAIPLSARVFAVADVCDALSHDRPYRKRWSIDEVRSYVISNSGTHFDPDVVASFLRLDPLATLND